MLGVEPTPQKTEKEVRSRMIVLRPPVSSALTRMMPNGTFAQFSLFLWELTNDLPRIKHQILGILGQKMGNKMPHVIN